MSLDAKRPAGDSVFVSNAVVRFEGVGRSLSIEVDRVPVYVDIAEKLLACSAVDDAGGTVTEDGRMGLGVRVDAERFRRHNGASEIARDGDGDNGGKCQVGGRCRNYPVDDIAGTASHQKRRVLHGQRHTPTHPRRFDDNQLSCLLIDDDGPACVESCDRCQCAGPTGSFGKPDCGEGEEIERRRHLLVTHIDRRDDIAGRRSRW